MLNDVLCGFAKTTDNWDSYGAKATDPRAIEKAQELLPFLPDWGWQAFPLPSGGVQLEMSQDGFDIEIQIEPHDSPERRALGSDILDRETDGKGATERC